MGIVRIESWPICVCPNELRHDLDSYYKPDIQLPIFHITFEFLAFLFNSLYGCLPTNDISYNHSIQNYQIASFPLIATLRYPKVMCIKSPVESWEV